MRGKAPAALLRDADSALGVLHHVPDDDRPITPERRLWLSVIARCWADAFEASDWFLRASETALKRRDFDPDATRGEARRWLILDFGEWKSDRETVCDLAGVDPDLVRNAARRKLARVKAGEKPAAEVVSLDSMFTRLLESETTMDPDELDTALAELAALEAAA